MSFFFSCAKTLFLAKSTEALFNLKRKIHFFPKTRKKVEKFKYGVDSTILFGKHLSSNHRT